MPETISAGDALPSSGKIIEVRVSELRSLFNSMDPSPFRNRDLDPSAEEFIVSSGSCLAMCRSAYWSISIGPLGRRMKPQSCARRFISSSVRKALCHDAG